MSEYIKKEDVLKLIDTGCLISNSNYNKEIKLINELPSADVEPVRHGYWFKDEKFYHDIMVDGNPVCLYHTCSVCGVADEYITVDERPNGTHVILRHVRKYCPNCGAKMDKGVAHGKEQEHE